MYQICLVQAVVDNKNSVIEAARAHKIRMRDTRQVNRQYKVLRDTANFANAKEANLLVDTAKYDDAAKYDNAKHVKTRLKKVKSLLSPKIVLAGLKNMSKSHRDNSHPIVKAPSVKKLTSKNYLDPRIGLESHVFKTINNNPSSDMFNKVIRRFMCFLLPMPCQFILLSTFLIMKLILVTRQNVTYISRI